MSRLQISLERNATRNLIRASENSKPKQFVQLNEFELKTSPLQSILSSVEESSMAGIINPGIELVKVENYKEITDGILMDNYQADSRLRNVGDAVLTRDNNLLSQNNKLYRHVC